MVARGVLVVVARGGGSWCPRGGGSWWCFWCSRGVLVVVARGVLVVARGVLVACSWWSSWWWWLVVSSWWWWLVHICSQQHRRTHVGLLSAAGVSLPNQGFGVKFRDAITLIINYLSTPLGRAFVEYFIG